MPGINEYTKTLLRDKLMKDKRKEGKSSRNDERVSVKRSVSPVPHRCKRRIIEDSVEQVLRDTIFQLSVNKLQYSRWKAHEPPLSRTVLIWNMVRVIDKEIQKEKVVDDVFSLLGDAADHNVKFIKVCRASYQNEGQIEEEDEEDVEMTAEPVTLVSDFVGGMDWNKAATPLTA